MSNQIQSEGTKALNQAEHNPDANAKRVLLRGQDPATGDFVNIGASDNGDGTYGLKSSDPAFATRLDDDNDPELYIGKAAVGADEGDPVWQIAKLDTSSGLVKTWADGAAFTQVWDDHLSLTYE